MCKGMEPERLRAGKVIHKRIQNEWHKNAEGLVNTEKSVTKPSGRKGRMDVFVVSDEKLVAVVEIKCSKWDRMTSNGIRRNVNRQAHQIWDYIESQLKLQKEVCPGIIFPKLTKDSDRMKLVEELFNKEGIAVVWEEETVTKEKAEC